MTVPLSNYALRYREACASAVSGRRGAISDSRFFVDNYGQGCYDVLLEGLEHEDPRVRAETVLLFSRLGITKPRDIITEMSYNDRDSVSGACVAYLKGLEASEERIPELLYTANHRNGEEFRSAMRTLGGIASAKDIPEIRRIYGQVDGEMHEQTRAALSRIVDRDPDLERKRMFVLSEPVYPDEDAFVHFLDRFIEYLDVRYREKIHPRRDVKLRTYNNVVSAILTMQIRLYNEETNLNLYGRDTKDSARYLNDLIFWAAEDLKSKNVVKPEGPGRVSNIGDYSRIDTRV